MPKIKQKNALIKKAEGHREADRFRQAHGYMQANESRWDSDGEIPAPNSDFKGCAVGCLALPVSRKGILAKLRELAEESMNENRADLDREQGVALLEKQHGITYSLAGLLEWVFESLEENGLKPEDWPVDFAKALPSGVEINEEDVDNFVRNSEYCVEAELGEYAGNDDVEPYIARGARDEVLEWFETLAA